MAKLFDDIDDKLRAFIERSRCSSSPPRRAATAGT